MNKIKLLIVAVVALAALGLGLAFLTGNDAPRSGAVVTSTTQAIQKAAGFIAGTSGIKFGTSGSTVTQLLVGTCNLISDASIAATSTAAVDCAVTGSVAGDKVFVSLATTTPSTNLGWRITGANASSTSGYITVKLMNLTGAAAVPSVSSVGSSTQYLIIR